MASLQVLIFSNNSKYIFDYFENKKNISTSEIVENSDKNNIVKQFFSLNINDDISNNLLEQSNKNVLIKKSVTKYILVQ